MADDTDTAPADDPEDADLEAGPTEDDAGEAPAFSTPLLEAARAPIPGDAPAGVDMKYEDDFQELKAQVDLLGSAKGDVDFDAIVEMSASILSDRSKDLSVASYLVLGLTRTRGYQGIAEGLAVVRAVTEGFWADAFPPLRRIRGRQSALQFVAERASAWMGNDDRRPGPEDRDALELAQAELAALQAFTTEEMGDDAPALGALGREIREALRRLPEPEPDEPEPEPEPEPDDLEGEPGLEDDAEDEPAHPPPASPAPAASEPAPAASGGGTASYDTVDGAKRVVLEVADFYSTQDPYDATAFALRRAVVWGVVVQAPPSGVFPPPPEFRRELFETMAASANYQALVEQGESFFPQHPFPFWLDLQRMLATALRALGPTARAAAGAVESATAALVARLPDLPGGAFQDGTPFADPLTAAWLDELTAGDGGGGGGGGVDEATLEAIEAAQEQAAEGDVPGAVSALMAGAGPTRDRFERTVAAAQLCLNAGRPDVALGLLDDAVEVVETHNLALWDPPSAARAYRLVYTCAAATDDYARSEDAVYRLIKLDPGHAIRSTAPPT